MKHSVSQINGDRSTSTCHSGSRRAETSRTRYYMRVKVHKENASKPRNGNKQACCKKHTSRKHKKQTNKPIKLTKHKHDKHEPHHKLTNMKRKHKTTSDRKPQDTTKLANKHEGKIT
ncbi:hypothetical protein KC19_8G154400 [Ceratodon purpureus]|uniref:Uncharacterized protein n=1 Tax=Ceratodon purpureus TaxID=3225 RepID=A0A8T0GZA7_CERPU|nr:hypothetical protein KC19_8G154400 [Ceratodon purpureus]